MNIHIVVRKVGVAKFHKRLVTRTNAQGYQI